MMNEEKQVMNALVNLMVCPRCPGTACCKRCSYIGTENCHGRLISDSMTVLNNHFGSKAATVKHDTPDYECMVVDALREIGIPAGLLGYRYIIRATMLAISSRDYIDAMTCVMYPTVAKEFDTTAARVERAIRHSVEVAWNRGDPDVLYHYFGNSISGDRGKPTNTEFIATLAECIKQRSRDSFYR